MKLSPRLKTIADLVPKNSIVADVGTDHGYIPIYLITNNISKKIIATDINKGPLDNAKESIEEYKLTNYIETRLGSGLKPIEPKEIDVVIIAGMGGLLIRDILQENIKKTKTIDTLILQPMIAAEEVRIWLENNNYIILKEKLAKEDNKIYEIILAKKGHMEISDSIYYEIGPKLMENKEVYLKDLINLKIRKYENILTRVENEKSEKAKTKKDECIKKLEKLQEMKKCL